MKLSSSHRQLYVCTTLHGEPKKTHIRFVFAHAYPYLRQNINMHACSACTFAVQFRRA